MPQVARKGDQVLTGHLCDMITTIDKHSPNVFANNIEVARKNDQLVEHSAYSPPSCSSHTSQINVGSATVFVNNIPIARFFDSADVGFIIQGSNNVFAGDSGAGTIEDSEVETPVPVTPKQQATYISNVQNVAKYNTPTNIAEGIDNHPELEDDPDSPPPPPVTSSVVNPDCQQGSGGDMGAALDNVLAEARNGDWKENGHNPKIEALYANVGFSQFKGDQTAWCAGFVGSTLKDNCFKFNKSLAAGSYTNYGNPVPGGIENAQKGDVLVFNRDGGTGHVAFYYGPSERPGYVKVVGGNQSNNVTLMDKKISELKPNGVQRPTPA